MFVLFFGSCVCVLRVTSFRVKIYFARCGESYVKYWNVSIDLLIRRGKKRTIVRDLGASCRCKPSLLTDRPRWLMIISSSNVSFHYFLLLLHSCPILAVLLAVLFALGTRRTSRL